MRLRFLGAAENVTGSCYFMEANGVRFTIDGGLYQEREFRGRNWEPLAEPPESLDAVLLTHGHLDHCGLLPKFYRDGFRGRIICTPATADIAQIVMLDSAKIQTEDVKRKRRRHEREGRVGPFPYEPLYTVEDAEGVCNLFDTVPYGVDAQVGDGVTARFRDAGHILGSASIAVTVREGGRERTIGFSGDVGRCNTPILRDPDPFDSVDYILCESTYGNRSHKDNVGIPERLSAVVNETIGRGGHVLIPSFSVERAQEVLYYLSGLLTGRKIPPVEVFLDSPMAVRVTEVFQRHRELFDEEMMNRIRHGEHPCDFPKLHMCRSVEESKAVNARREPSIIIAGSGMCTGGRIKHHLVHNVSRPECTLLFVGYQARGTLGRMLLERKSPIRILGVEHEVAMEVKKLNGFSAHADRDELMQWLGGVKNKPRHAFITHGEEEAAHEFAEAVASEKGWDVSVATFEQTVELD